MDDAEPEDEKIQRKHEQTIRTIAKTLDLGEDTITQLTDAERELLATMDDEQLAELGMVLDGTLEVDDDGDTYNPHDSLANHGMQSRDSHSEESEDEQPESKFQTYQEQKWGDQSPINISAQADREADVCEENKNQPNTSAVNEKVNPLELPGNELLSPSEAQQLLRGVSFSDDSATKWISKANSLVSKAIEWEQKREWNRAMSLYVSAGEILLEALATSDSKQVQDVIKRSIDDCLKSVKQLKKRINQNNMSKVYEAVAMMKKAEQLEESEHYRDSRNIYSEVAKQLRASLPEVAEDEDLRVLVNDELQKCLVQQRRINRRFTNKPKETVVKNDLGQKRAVLPELSAEPEAGSDDPLGTFIVGDRVTIQGLTKKPQYNFVPGVICGPFDVEKNRFPVKLLLSGSRRKVLKVQPKNLELSSSLGNRGFQVREAAPTKKSFEMLLPKSKKNTFLWPLPPDVASHICTFLEYADIPRLAKVCQAWKKAIFSRPYASIWRTIIIGANPFNKGWGHSIKLKWLLLSGVTDYVETLLVSKGMIGEFFPDEDTERYLAVINMPRLRSLILYGTPIEDYEPIYKNHPNLYCLFTEDNIDLNLTLEDLPHLRAISASIIDVEHLRQVKSVYKQMEFLSFIFGVNSSNVNLIFCTFPHLKHVALELEEVIEDLPSWAQHAKLKTLHLSWKPGKFLTIPKTKRIADREEVMKWLAGFSFLNWLIVDRDFLFDNGSSLLYQARKLLPTVQVTTSPQSALKLFWSYIGESY